jgi:hypothetical protein
MKWQLIASKNVNVSTAIIINQCFTRENVSLNWLVIVKLYKFFINSKFWARVIAMMNVFI